MCVSDSLALVYRQRYSLSIATASSLRKHSFKILFCYSSLEIMELWKKLVAHQYKQRWRPKHCVSHTWFHSACRFHSPFFFPAVSWNSIWLLHCHSFYPHFIWRIQCFLSLWNDLILINPSGNGSSGRISNRRGVWGCKLVKIQELSAQRWSRAWPGSFLLGSSYTSFWFFFCAECPVLLTFTHKCTEDIRVLNTE